MASEKTHKKRKRPEIKEEYKRLKEIREETHDIVMKLKRPSYTNGFLMAVRLAKYFVDRRAQEKPLTVAGLELAVGLSNNAFVDYRGGESDHLIDDVISGVREDYQASDFEEEYESMTEEERVMYQILTGNAFTIEDERYIYFSDIIEKADKLLSLEREERLYEKGRVADIFALKALDGWQEEEVKQRQNHTLVIEAGGATKALELLGYKKDE